jgi:hypothetical protein
MPTEVGSVNAEANLTIGATFTDKWVHALFHGAESGLSFVQPQRIKHYFGQLCLDRVWRL